MDQAGGAPESPSGRRYDRGGARGPPADAAVDPAAVWAPRKQRKQHLEERLAARNGRAAVLAALQDIVAINQETLLEHLVDCGWSKEDARDLIATSNFMKSPEYVPIAPRRLFD
uniref:Uncharacterized protein n=1 Tax=Rhizochromulina marina TaxID=1034831 RepID=A0A7S2SNX0_9STRA|mmetsp:Transcript_33358/g.96676  ORF Transcript_33358/g.96676 Transcript_33358/m.96676 type:complete len:114 (+) Transcript_33358:87-428(+)